MGALLRGGVGLLASVWWCSGAGTGRCSVVDAATNLKESQCLSRATKTAGAGVRDGGARYVRVQEEGARESGRPGKEKRAVKLEYA